MVTKRWWWWWWKNEEWAAPADFPCKNEAKRQVPPPPPTDYTMLSDHRCTTLQLIISNHYLACTTLLDVWDVCWAFHAAFFLLDWTSRFEMFIGTKKQVPRTTTWYSLSRETNGRGLCIDSWKRIPRRRSFLFRPWPFSGCVVVLVIKAVSSSNIFFRTP